MFFLIKVTEFVLIVLWTFHTTESSQSPWEVLNYDVYLRGKNTSEIQEIFSTNEILSTIDWAPVFRLILLTPIVEEIVFRGLLFSAILWR